MQTFKLTKKDYLSGIFLIVAISVFIFIPFYINYLHSKEKFLTYYTFFDSTYGIKQNSQIFYLEMPIGYVEKIEIIDLNRVKITLKINNKFKEFITISSKISILSSLGLNTIISGKGLQVITTQKDSILPEGSIIKSIPPENINSIIKKFEIDKLSKSIKQIILNLEKLTTQIVDKNSPFQKSLNSIDKLTNNLATKPTLEVIVGKQNFNQTSNLLNNLNLTLLKTQKLLKEIELILKQKEIKTSIKEIEQTLKTVKKITNNIFEITNTIKKGTNKENIQKIEEILNKTNHLLNKIQSIKIFQPSKIDTDFTNIK